MGSYGASLNILFLFFIYVCKEVIFLYIGVILMCCFMVVAEKGDRAKVPPVAEGIEYAEVILAS